jgi:hypothetical protein
VASAGNVDVGVLDTQAVCHCILRLKGFQPVDKSETYRQVFSLQARLRAYPLTNPLVFSFVFRKMILLLPMEE